MIAVLAFVALVVIATGVPTGLWARTRRRPRFDLRWAEFTTGCCHRAWLTHGERHDTAACRARR